jgi:hypothetical protein
MKCKCFIVLFVSISAVMSFDTTWHAPLRTVIVHTHRLEIYDASPDTIEGGHYDDGADGVGQ